MTTSLLDSLNGLATPELTARLATSLNEPAHSVAGAFTGGMASMLTGVLGKSGDPTAMQSIFGTVTDGVNDGHVLDDPESFVTSGQNSPMASLGSSFLTRIFGTQSNAVTDALSKTSGLHGSSITTLLRFAAPLVLGVLGKRVREGGLNLSTFTELFSHEAKNIQRVTPKGVASALGMKEYTPVLPAERAVVSEVTRSADSLPAVRRAEPEQKSRGWVVPAVAALAAVGLLWGVYSKTRSPSVPSTPRVAVVSGGEVAIPSPSKTHVFGSVLMRNGAILYVAPSSAEGRLVAFLNDSLHGVEGATWVVLDHMQFETNSAKLTSSSDEEIKNLAKVLDAYPTAKVRIGGFTDNMGDASANLRLSRERAESAREALLQNGVDKSRVVASGYGEAHPIASNSTEDGRAQNRRISMLVTAR